MGNLSRSKGHGFERKIAEDFRELGFEDAMTTRAAKGGNWCATDNGVDLCNTGAFAVQCKRFKGYAPITAIEEINRYCDEKDSRYCPSEKSEAIPLLITKADGKPTMAVLPWDELRKLIMDYHNPV